MKFILMVMVLNNGEPQFQVIAPDLTAQDCTDSLMELQAPQDESLTYYCAIQLNEGN